MQSLVIPQTSIRDGLEIFIEDSLHKESYTRLIKDSNTALFFVFSLAGRMHCIFPGCDRLYDVGADQTLLLFSPQSFPRFENLESDHIHRVWIRIERQRLKQYYKKTCPALPGQLRRILHEDGGEPFVYRGFLSASMKTAAHQIAGCPFKDPHLTIFLESKALELIACHLEEMCSQSMRVCGGCSCCRLTPEDIRRIQKAREILVGDLEFPPGLEVLAARVGLNVTKLKRGFRQLYGTSVFAYLRACRMETARRILEVGEMNVTEAAMTVGYSNIGHFCAVFKKQFGIKPGCCRREACRFDDGAGIVKI